MLRFYSITNDIWALQELHRQAQRDFGSLDLRVDRELSFYKELTPLICSREEALTVRFSKGKIRMPSGFYIPWFETDPQDEHYKRRVGELTIPLVVVAHVKDFPKKLALLDTYNGKDEMIADIEDIYATKLEPTDVLSAYIIGDLL